jgi:hypothetical protein
MVIHTNFFIKSRQRNPEDLVKTVLTGFGYTDFRNPFRKLLHKQDRKNLMKCSPSRICILLQAPILSSRGQLI